MDAPERTVAGLSCSQVLARLGDFVDGDLPATEVARVRAHLDGCDGCARFGAGYGAIVEELRRAGDAGLDPEVAGRLRARLDRR